MTLDELKEKLRQCDTEDEERGHIEADRLLLAYIADEEVTKLHDELAVWFA